MEQDEVTVRLRAMKPLADRLARTQGINTVLWPSERAQMQTLRTLHDEGWFAEDWRADELRRAAGLLPSDWSLLIGWLLAEDQRRDPAGVLIELKALLGGTQNRAAES